MTLYKLHDQLCFVKFNSMHVLQEVSRPLLEVVIYDRMMLDDENYE